jgi:hypothetical protein
MIKFGVVFVNANLLPLKTMRTIKFPVIVLVVLLALSSCRKIEQLPVIPHIEFRSFAVFDTLDPFGNISKCGRLKFHFEDGDGNIGVQAVSDIQVDTTNLFFTLFRKTGGSMVEVPANDPLKPSAYRIPYLERLGQNKILKGTISVTFLYLFYSPTDSDTIKYDFYLKDRALNESNVASTSEIVLSVNNVYVK